MASSFLAGFAQGATRAIEEKRSFIRDTVERRREELRQQGYDRLNQTRALRQGFQQGADILLSAGMTQENVVALLEDNPSMFNMVAANVGQLAMAGEPPQNINSLVRFANNSRPSGTSLAEAINNAVPGIIRANEGVTDPARRERNSIAAMLGLSTEEALQRNVYGEELVQGFTGADIAASTNMDLIAPSRGQIQIDYSAFRPEQELDPRLARDFINDLATSYSQGIVGDISALNGLAATAIDFDNLTTDERDDFLTQLEPYGIVLEDPSDTQALVTQIQEGIMRREQILEEPPSFLIQSAIEDLKMSDERLLQMIGVNPGIMSPLFFESPFVEKYLGREPQTETETVQGAVTDEAAAQTEEAFTPEPVEQTFEQMASVAEQAASVLDSIDIGSLPQNQREDVEGISTYNTNTGSYVPTEEFVSWLSQDPTRVRQLQEKPEVAFEQYLTQAGVLSEDEVVSRTIERGIGALEGLTFAPELDQEVFGAWRESNNLLDEDVAREEAKDLLRFVRTNYEDFSAWVMSSPERITELRGNPLQTIQQFYMETD